MTDLVSPAGIRFRSATTPALDEELTCNVQHIGPLSARVVGLEAGAFVIRVLAKRQTIVGVARELCLLAERQGTPVPVRRHPRVTPAETEVAVLLDDGRLLPARLLNVSASGAAFTIGAALGIGAPVTIGRTSARVACHLERGVGALFRTPFAPECVDRHITL